MSILILTGCTIAGAVVGGGISALIVGTLSGRKIEILEERYEEEAIARTVANMRLRRIQKRVAKALDHIGPYHRGANGTAQKIGKILRGER